MHTYDAMRMGQALACSIIDEKDELWESLQEVVSFRDVAICIEYC